MKKLEEIDNIGAEEFAISMIGTGIFIGLHMYEPFSKVIGGFLLLQEPIHYILQVILLQK